MKAESQIQNTEYGVSTIPLTCKGRNDLDSVARITSR